MEREAIEGGLTGPIPAELGKLSNLTSTKFLHQQTHRNHSPGTRQPLQTQAPASRSKPTNGHLFPSKLGEPCQPDRAAILPENQLTGTIPPESRQPHLTSQAWALTLQSTNGAYSRRSWVAFLELDLFASW